jgi:phosphate transport system permease protein
MATEPLIQPPPRVAAERPTRRRPRARTARRRVVVDRVARWVVAAGGVAIIASVLGILVFILAEVWPLLRPGDVTIEGAVPLADTPRAVVVDEHRTLAATLDAGGRLAVISLADGRRLDERDLVAGLAPPALDAPFGEEPPPAAAAAPAVVAVAAPPGGRVLTLATADGRLVAQPVDWTVSFDADAARRVTADLPAPILLDLDPLHRPLGAFSLRAPSADLATAAAQLTDGTVEFVRRETTHNAFTGASESSEGRFALGTVPPLAELLLDEEGRNLYGGTVTGDLLWWDLAGGTGSPPQTVSAGSAPITALGFLVGDRSLVVGQESGALSVWFPVRRPDESFRLTRIRDFPARPAAIAFLSASTRNRTFLAGDRGGGLGLYYSTSGRVIWQGSSPLAPVSAAVIAPKGDGALLAGRGELARLDFGNPHPEVSWRALFGKVWYEGYERPELVWQSTGGSDDFESKLSLTPLVVGTLKGTLYSLLLAIPLGVFGAMFASQFLHPRLLGYVKPTVEIMAALPSVVLGFLAGLWLAPLLERSFPALLLMVVACPLAVVASGAAWSRLPPRLRNRFPSGAELGLYVIVLAATLAACLALSPAFEALAFGGDFQQWLLATTGLKYDQRNAIVVGLAMGFAVIPIIFAISEDAFSNVPASLTAGSLALGASRWQTVTRVVLPTASPGIFSAIMIGFGRAVGETMIVLMATGNTPIMDFSPFNGFRTLSANIAVEIPEAPLGGTLYRTLFLAALVLFLFTFTVNTVAELVRQRLRQRFAQL